MRKMRLIGVLLVAVSLSLAVLIKPLFAANWEEQVTVNTVFLITGHYVIDTNATGGTCGSPGRFVILKDAGNAKEMYATAVAALLAGKKISIFHSEPQECMAALQGTISVALAIHN